jgi:hypothetical protein
VAALHARSRAALALHVVGRVPANLGTQHSRRRGAALFDHLPDHGRSKELTARTYGLIHWPQIENP